MKKLRQALCLLLILALLPLQAFAIPVYNKSTNSFEWDITVANATTNITFQTMAFKFTLNGENGTYTANMPSTTRKSPYSGGDGTTTFYYRALVANDENNKTERSLYQSFKEKYDKNTDDGKKAMADINKAFGRGFSVIADSVVVVKYSGKAQGTVDAKGYWASGEVIDNKNDFKTAEAWGQKTKDTIPNMYEIPLRVPPQSVDPPTPVISRGSSEVSTSHEEYEQGEVIDLLGRLSKFPEVVEKHYKWLYRKKGASTWSDGGTKLNIDLPNPELGDYEVQLSTSYSRKVTWQDTPLVMNCVAPAEATITINPNKDVTALIQLSSPPEVVLQKGQTSASVPVTLSSNLTLLQASDVVKVEYFIRTQGGYQVYTDADFSTTTVSKVHSFNILYSGTPFLQSFEAQAVYTLTNGSKVESVIADSQTYIRRLGDDNRPPVAILNYIPDVTVGSEVYLNGSKSYDPDGTIVNYDFEIPAWGFHASEEGHSTASRLAPVVGTYQAVLTVTDNDGLNSNTDTYFKVVPPKPSVNIEVAGYLKENRRVKLKANVYNPMGYTTTEDQITWTITPMNGQTGSICTTSGKGRNIDALFKEKGSYMVSVTAYNNTGASDTAIKVLNISEDIAPTPVIDAFDTQYRDQDGKLTIKAYDYSESLDNDFIAQRIFAYAFDSDNDGDFNDETKVTVKTSTLPEDNFVDIPVSHVGRYKLFLTVKEGFGQETLAQFVTESDYKSGMTTLVVNVDNYKPKVGFDAIKTKKIDLTIATDYTGSDLTALGDRLNKYIADSYDDYLDVKLNFITDTKHLGRYLPEGINKNGFDLVQDTTDAKYKIATWGALTEWSDHSYDISYTTSHLYTNTTTETHDVFPAAIKDSYTYNYGQATLWLLENGDVYFIGTNSINSAGVYSSPDIFCTKPTKILSDVKQIDGNHEIIYLLSNSGSVYVIGGEFQGAVQGGVFDTFYNQYNLSSVIPYVNDTAGYSRLYNYYTSGTFSGYKSAVKIPSLSNISYIWSDGSALVVRTTTGAWYGFGKGLNGFGLSTGFQNSPPGTVLSWEKLSCADSYNRLYQLDNTNNLTYLKNLSDLDSKVGGIEKIAPNYAYAKNGDKYYFKETPTVLFGHKTYSAKADIPTGSTYTVIYESPVGYTPYSIEVMYPFQINDSKFEYSKVGTWLSEKTQYNTSTSYMQNLLTYADFASGLTITPGGTTGTMTETSQNKVTSKASEIKTTVPSIYIYSGITDYTAYAFYVTYTYEKSVYDSSLRFERYNKDDQLVVTYGGYYNTFNYTVYPKVIPYQLNQAGKKVYGIKLDNYPSTTFRENSKKYLVYLDHEDSFKKIPKAVGDYISKSDIDVKISAKASYIDGDYNKASEINLRQLANDTPYGKLYKEDGIEEILADITAENEVIRKGDDGIYLIKGEDEATYKTYYTDLENDPKLSEVFNHIHDEKYFENSEGISQYHNIQRTEPVKALDKVGKYRVFYKATDQPTKEEPFQEYNRESDVAEAKVYVHRRAIAQMVVSLDNRIPLKLTAKDDLSYDLDHESESERGIETVEWGIKGFYENDWKITTGKLGTVLNETLKEGDTYLVRYRVKDKEGAWSKPVMKSVKAEIKLELEAALRAEKSSHSLSRFPAGNNVVFHDIWTSYPKAHRVSIQMYDGAKPMLSPVVLSREAGNILSETYPEIDWNPVTFLIPKQVDGVKLADKTYQFLVKAYDVNDENIKTEKTFQVTTVSNQPPKVSIANYAPKTLYEGDLHHIEVKVEDPDLDALSLKLYMRYDGGKEVLYQSFSNLYSGQTVQAKALTIENHGQIQWRAVVTDPLGESDEATLTLPIKAFGISEFDIKGAWQHWRGQKNAFGKQMSNEPYRFLSYEALTFEAKTRGDVSKVSLRLSTELEAMRYTDKRGHVYDYKDEVGKNVVFPIIFGSQKPNIYNLEYILPLASSTIGDDDQRIRSAYLIYITISNSERTRTYIYGDEADEPKIDITGNIFDHVYNQP